MLKLFAETKSAALADQGVLWPCWREPSSRSAMVMAWQQLGDESWSSEWGKLDVLVFQRSQWFFKIFSMWKMSIKNDIVVVFSSVVLSTVNQWGFSIKFCVLHWASVLLKHLCSRLVLLSPIPFQLTLSQQNHSVTPVVILNNPLYVHC